MDHSFDDFPPLTEEAWVTGQDRKIKRTRKKGEAWKDFMRHDQDTGSCEVQIAIMTAEIQHISDHIKSHKKDFSALRGLLQAVSKRRSLLQYLKKTAPSSYQHVVKAFNIRVRNESK